MSAVEGLIKINRVEFVFTDKDQLENLAGMINKKLLELLELQKFFSMQA